MCSTISCWASWTLFPSISFWSSWSCCCFVSPFFWQSSHFFSHSLVFFWSLVCSSSSTSLHLAVWSRSFRWRNWKPTLLEVARATPVSTKSDETRNRKVPCPFLSQQKLIQRYPELSHWLSSIVPKSKMTEDVKTSARLSSPEQLVALPPRWE